MNLVLSEAPRHSPLVLQGIHTTHLNSDTILELLDFGLLPGTQLEILKDFPSQKKILVALPSSEIVLRLDTAREITVLPLGSP